MVQPRLGHLARAARVLAELQPGVPQRQVAAELASGALVDEVHTAHKRMVRQAFLSACQARRLPAQLAQLLQPALVLYIAARKEPRSGSCKRGLAQLLPACRACLRSRSSSLNLLSLLWRASGAAPGSQAQPVLGRAPACAASLLLVALVPTVPVCSMSRGQEYAAGTPRFLLLGR